MTVTIREAEGGASHCISIEIFNLLWATRH